MIALNLKEFNSKSYNNEINNLEVGTLECTCGCKGNCIKWGRYDRKVTYNDKKHKFYIQRIYCKSCCGTNALLPVGSVPYQMLSLDDMVEIVETYEELPNDKYDSEAARVIERYKKWKARLVNLKLSIKDDILKIIHFCAERFLMCFMQGKRKVYRRDGKLFEVVYMTIGTPT